MASINDPSWVSIASSDFFVEILSRLPVKTLGSFSTVCKSWHSFIKTKTFIQTHLKNYCQKNSSSIELPSIPYLSCSSNTIILDEISKNLMAYCTPQDLSVVGNSCNGIICFTDNKTYYGTRVFLSNPILKKTKCISHFWKTDFRPYLNIYSKLGFGCLEYNDFKVVRIYYFKDINSSKLLVVKPQVEVYSSKADNWRKIDEANINCIADKRSVSCNGAIYWLGRRREEWSCDIILSFDLANESFDEITLPPIESKVSRNAILLVYNGLLAFWTVSSVNNNNNTMLSESNWRRSNMIIGSLGQIETEYCYDLWVMMDKKVSNSWRKLGVFETKKNVTEVRGFTNGGKLIMEIWESDYLASWDPINGEIQFLKWNEIDTTFFGSLVSF